MNPPEKNIRESQDAYVERVKTWARQQNNRFAEHCRLAVLRPDLYKIGPGLYRVGDPE